MTDFLRVRRNTINPYRCSGITNKGARCRSVGHYKAPDGTWRCKWHRVYS